MSGAWNFVPPQEGWRAWVEAEQGLFLFTAAAGWVAFSGGNGEEVERLGINAAADNTNRLSINAEASLFNHAGAGHRLNINKADVRETASIVFQSDFSGRAEIGLTGRDALHVRVSADGVDFADAVVVETDGRVDFPNGINAGLLTEAVDIAGGADTIIGPPNLISTASSRRSFSLISNRIYFCPFYVDRPTRYLGGKVAVSQAATTAGALMRVGLYGLGVPDENSWRIGDRLADYGTQPADVAGHKTFTSEQAITLMQGWYLQTVGVDGQGLEVNALEWQTPGVLHFVPSGQDTSANFRLGGVARYLSDNVGADIVRTGFPEIWTNNPVSDVVSTVFSQLMLVIPFWDRRSW